MRNQANQKKLASLLTQACKAKYLDQILEILLTYDEYEQVLTRVQIIAELLAQKHSQRDIAAKHNVSIAKITRGSNMLKTMDPKLKTFLNKQLVGKE